MKLELTLSNKAQWAGVENGVGITFVDHAKHTAANDSVSDTTSRMDWRKTNLDTALLRIVGA